MQIHVVRKDQTLNDIVKLYNADINDIININEILEPDELIEGQALVIPIEGRFHIVQEGDSLYKLGLMYNVDYKQIANINDISVGATLELGKKLFIPPIMKTDIESNAYVEPIGNEVSKELIDATTVAVPFLTYLAPFSFRMNRDGTLAEPLLDNFADIAKEQQTTLMLVVTNLEEGEFSDELARSILTNEQVQNTLLNNIVNKANELNVSDVHFDLEFIPVELKDEYANFLRKAKERFRKERLLLSVALAPKTSAKQVGEWYEAHDYGMIGEIADFVVLMTYEWGYVAGPPMPISPLPQVTEVVEYALTEMPASKIMLGQNLYGYDWKHPYQEGTYATTVSPQRAIEIARENNAIIEYDRDAEAPFIKYSDKEGKDHIVWFEDARSLQAKFALIKDLDLRGISFWKLDFDFPQVWPLLEDSFNIIKKEAI